MNELNVLSLGADELRKLALGVKAQAGLSWFRLSVVVWRVENEGLYDSWGYTSARAWSQDELGIPPRDFVTLLELGKMVMNAGSGVEAVEWEKLNKAKALLVKKVSALGGNCRQWVLKAMAAKTTTEFAAEVKIALGGKPEEWTTFKCAVPAELLELIDAALVMALPKALPDELVAPPERARDKDARFRCLEVIITEWVQDHALTVEAL